MSLHSTALASADHAHLLTLAHERSLRYGLTLRDAPDYQRLASGALRDALDQHRFLCQHATPVMEHLFSQINNTGSILVLTSASGLVLHSLGDSDFLPKADQVALVPGVDWSEQAQGTNAIGTALQERQAITVQGAEHFLQANHSLACACAPIFGPHGQLMGALDVTSEHHRHHPHTLALVRMSVQMLENQMLAAQFPQAIRLHFHARPEFLGTLMEGIAVFSPDGQLLSLNRSAQFQCSLTDAQPQSVPTQHFSMLFRHPLTELLQAGAQQLMLDSGVLVACRIHLPHSAEAVPRPTAAAAAPNTHNTPTTSQRLSHLQYLDTGDTQLAHTIARLRKVLDKNIPVMLLGETGTGKDLLARAWHQDSARASQPFIAVNCASIPESLIEAELFGYADGAFTGARKKGAVGKIAQAHGGTLFLDEIGDMPLPLQARLLRVLQERCISPLGSEKDIPIDIAVVCATHQDLKARIAQGLFREDLYYRLNGLAVRLPALRERTDLPAVIAKVLQAVQPEGATCTLAPEVLQRFLSYPWPGNVRQLHNVLRTACVMACATAEEESIVTCADLPDDFLDDYQETVEYKAPTAMENFDFGQETHKLNDLTLQRMAQALAEHQGNVSAAAKVLGISRNTFYRKKGLLPLPKNANQF